MPRGVRRRRVWRIERAHADGCACGGIAGARGEGLLPCIGAPRGRGRAGRHSARAPEASAGPDRVPRSARGSHVACRPDAIRRPRRKARVRRRLSDAVRAQKWQLNHSDGDDDVEHIGSFIDALVKRVCADPKRVSVRGFSSGGGFAYRAGCELRDRVAAIAPVSGSYRSHDPCSAGPMPTLELHGRDPWTGTVPRLVSDMKRRNGCTSAPLTRRIARGITRTRWPGCNLERIYNRTIGHEWPKLGPYNTSAEVWRFVRRYRRA